jgi:SPP1 family phage portal protein
MSPKVIQNTFTTTINYLQGVQSNFNLSTSYYNSNNQIANSQTNSAIYQLLSNGDDKRFSGKSPLRKADNKVSSNFYQILVDQEAGYLATTDPVINVDDDNLNEQIKQELGDNFSLTLQSLIVDASNAGIAWLHYWIDEGGNFRYAEVTPAQIYPVYSDDLAKDLVAVKRVYKQLNDSGEYDTIVEYWDDQTCTSFIRKNQNDEFELYECFNLIDNSTDEIIGQTSVFKHNLGEVPFIKFKKNIYEKTELEKVKGSIDIYDKVYNGFANDLEDIQQTVIVLKGYGGTVLADFLDTLRNEKAINVDSDGDVSQLQIEIPVEARNSMLETTKQKIFMEGQGIDPDKFMDNGALSGKAVKGLYASLDLKATMTEKNFRPAVAKLIRAIMRYLNVSDWLTRNISQQWSRNAIQDTLETAQALNAVAPFTSKRTLASANPFVEDVDQELANEADDKVNDGYGNKQALQRVLNSGDGNE